MKTNYIINMGLIGDLLGTSGASKVKRKIKADQEAENLCKEIAECDSKVEEIVKKYGVSLADARGYIAQEQRREKGKANLAKLKAGIKGAQAWKKKHIIPINTKGKKKASILSPKPASVLTWGKPKKKGK